MGKSKLDDEQWAALFAEEMAGVRRSVLAPRYGISLSTLCSQARRWNLLKRQTGAPDHSRRPPEGWPEDEPLPHGRSDLTPREWRAVLRRYQKGEAGLALAAEVGVSRGALTQRAAAMEMRKKDSPDSVDRRRVREPFPRPSSPPSEDDDPPGPPLKLHPHQVPPTEPWTTWLLLGGRGAGKSLAGASWLADQAHALGEGGRLALVGATLHDVREVMIEGVSGVRALPRWTRSNRPIYEPSRRRLLFRNGCVAHAFSAEDPDSLRGPQFAAAWADEFCAWPAVGARGAAETLAILRMGLRLPGPRAQAASDRVASDSAPPRLIVTTTPRPTRALIALKAELGCLTTTAPTALNAMNLTPGFLERLRALYGGTRREAQELEGRIVELDGALFTAEMLARARSPSPSPLEGEGSPAPSSSAKRDRATQYDSTIVAIDPTATTTGAACGIVAAAGRTRPDGLREAVILADRSRAGLTPLQWARRAVALAAEVGATALVAEVNQGGDMVRETLRAAGCALKVIEVRATRGKRVRAEPVAAFYEQGRVLHRPLDGLPLDALEEELMAFGGPDEASASLDRADALVWAVTHLLIDTPDGGWGPRARWV